MQSRCQQKFHGHGYALITRNAISGYLDRYPIDWDTPAAWDFAIDAKTVQQWVILGDPSLRIGGYPL